MVCRLSFGIATSYATAQGIKRGHPDSFRHSSRLQFVPPERRRFARTVEYRFRRDALAKPVNDGHSRQQHTAAVLSYQFEQDGRWTPVLGFPFGLGQFGYVERRVTQRHQLLVLPRHLDGLVKL